MFEQQIDDRARDATHSLPGTVLIRIPPETYEYRLGNRSALEWIVDQYQVSTDKRSGITNDPNREDDPEYILRLIGQVVYVSVETVTIVRALPGLGILCVQPPAHTESSTSQVRRDSGSALGN